MNEKPVNFKMKNKKITKIKELGISIKVEIIIKTE